jgi:hypothetical protein
MEFNHNYFRIFYLLIICSLLNCNPASTNRQKAINDHDRLLAWCIVPFDSQEREPAERIQMLQDLGFGSYAYDWRTKHLDSFSDEIKLARQSDIEISAVWMWIDGNADALNKLSRDNEKLLQIIQDSGLQTEIWLGINHNFFDDTPDKPERIRKASEFISFLQQRIAPLNCRLALYNHGDWFGDPENQLKIINSLDKPADVGIVYNFHHGHQQVDKFAELLDQMLPYLSAVNLNGMRVEGPKILPIGEGEREAQMIAELLRSDYDGPIGILGHVEDEDVALVLQRNLDGLAKIMANLNENK